jgi:2-hydroxychromene-2-carboxylate isomerase
MAGNRKKICVTVYTDYKSPYAYVAKNPTLALAVEYPVQLIWLPYTLKIEGYLGSVDQRSDHDWRKVKYGYMDARRFANRQGLVLMGPQRIYNGSLSSIGMLFAQKNGFFPAYHDATFERFWRRDLDIDSMDAMKAHIAELGGSPADFEVYANSEGSVEHQRIVAEAERMGIFGVPTCVVDGELFWGGDRIPMLREKIEQRLVQLNGR